jgi:TRAP-type uncharacterized transport system fused permease subunit
LLLSGPLIDIVRDTVTALVGIWLASAGITGHFMRPLTSWVRSGLVIGGLALLVPSQIFAQGWILEAFGAALSILLVAAEFKKSRA